MTSENEPLASLTSRIEQLERQNGLMKAVALGATALTLISTAISCRSQSAAATQKQVVAEEFVLVDSAGNKRGAWAAQMNNESPGPATDAGASLRFFAKDQSLLCGLSVGADSGGSLIFGSNDGQHFLLLGERNGMQMISGDEGLGPVSLTSAEFSGGDIDGIPSYGKSMSMYFLELRDQEGNKVFSTADYYGFNPGQGSGP